MTRSKNFPFIAAALFAALTAILSQIVIPIGPVPINLATLSVLLAGALLGAKYGALSQLVYLLLGAVGLPVFSSFSGGIGIIFGPRGGYLVGYIASAFLVGFIVQYFGRTLPLLITAMALGVILYLFLGTVWFVVVTKTGVKEALMICVVPFLLGDTLKIVVATILTKRVSTALYNKS